MTFRSFLLLWAFTSPAAAGLAGSSGPSRRSQFLALRSDFPTPVDADALGDGDGASRQDGGRASFDGDGAGILDASFWRGRSMATDFRVMDDLYPVAPLDRVTPTDTGTVRTVDPRPTAVNEPFPATGTLHDAVFVPPYLRPDAFPAVRGAPCICKFSNSACDCGGAAANDATYHFTKADMGVNSTHYALTPADVTYSDGDYWQPHVHGGIAAPADRLPIEHYPLQAHADAVHQLPTTAREDRVATDFARYMDQVEALSRDCDTVSAECTTPCRQGDNVTLLLGSTRVEAQVLSAHTGNVVQVEFVPAAAQSNASAPKVACDLQAGCTVFRPCFAQGMACVEQDEIESQDYAGRLQHENACPQNTTLCSSVRQILSATLVRKGGVACRAAAPTGL